MRILRVKRNQASLRRMLQAHAADSVFEDAPPQRDGAALHRLGNMT
jgi:hypothetical protein